MPGDARRKYLAQGTAARVPPAQCWLGQALYHARVPYLRHHRIGMARALRHPCCTGSLFGVPSSALLRTPLSRWLNVPGTYEGLLLDSKKKGALKHKLADVKIGPLRHVTGRHNDGDPVHMSVQVGFMLVAVWQGLLPG